MFSCCLIPFIFRETQHNPVCTVATISPAIARPSLVLIWLQSQGAEPTAALQYCSLCYTMLEFLNFVCCLSLYSALNLQLMLPLFMTYFWFLST